jgi:hypothetical protein
VQENLMQESRVQERRLITFAVWLLAAALSGPLGIVLHELGHYTAALSSGFPDSRISFASASYQNSQNFWQALASGERETAATIYPLHLAGLVAAAGPAVTAFLMLLSVAILFFAKPADFLAAFLAGLALMAGVRSFTGIYYVIAVRPYYPNARPFFDEINIARAFDVPVDWIAWPSVLVILLSWIIVVPRLTPDRWLKLPAVIMGPIIGIFLWAQIGPFIMP